MRRLFFALLALVTLLVSCDPLGPDGGIRSADKLSGITYQLNVYSFADSDGDGWGDIKGITEHLDYLDELGATALWLSPVQTSASYHGYDVLDYTEINPRLGTEADFKDLIDKARARNIDIYMDYVLNHSGEGEWFKSALSSEDSPYRSYYVLSSDPSADVAAGRIDNFAGAVNPGMGDWHYIKSGDVGYKGRLHFRLDWNSKTVTVTAGGNAVQTSNPSATKWLWVDEPGKLVGLYETSSGIFEITIDVNTPWGFLVRSSSTDWDNGHKWGGDGSSIQLGVPYRLNNTMAADIIFGGSGIWYFGSFSGSMPDLNYGPYSNASGSAAFKDLASSADKWINMGVKGFRLDAVMWIYQQQEEANASFLKQWYDRCNSTWKAAGGQGDFYMVGEAWDECLKMAPYYKGLPSLFNFSYWWTVKDRINKSRGNDFASTVLWFREQYGRYRPDFIDAIKLSNHDEDRAGSDLGSSTDKMKLAGAVLLTSPGKPFIYQGEELGYRGRTSGGDEFVRTPVKWTRNGSVPSAALNGKVDNAMLTAEISVEAQKQDKNSVLNVYKNFALARNKYKALARGEMADAGSSTAAGALWTMTCEDQTVLVAHNFGSENITLDADAFNLKTRIVSNGSVSAKDGKIALGPYSSAVFLQ